MSYDVKYGQIKGSELGFGVTLASGQNIPAASGKFVTRTSLDSQTVTICATAETHIMGHLEVEAIPNSVNTGSTLGTEVRKCVATLDAVFRVPVISGTYTAAYLGKKYDLNTNTSKIQGVALDSFAYGQLIIVGGDTDDNQWVDVMVNPTYLNVRTGD